MSLMTQGKKILVTVCSKVKELIKRMKIIAEILSIVILLAGMASCTKTDRLYDDDRTEIAMRPVMSVMPKAPVTGTEDPVGASFGVNAYYSSDYSHGQEWTSVSSVQPYFENRKFVKEDETFSGDPDCYWPHSGSLVFAGYSPYNQDVDPSFDPSSKTLSIKGFTSDGQTDLMYFLPELSNGRLKGLNTSTTPVPVSFSHALTLLEFNIKGIEGDEPIRLKKISIAKGKWYSTGDFTVTVGGNPEWENVVTSGNDDLEIYSPESGHPITTTPFSVSGLVIPGKIEENKNAVDIKIDYEVNAAQTYQKSGTVETSVQPIWVIGNKYIYDITIASGFIVVDPSVGNYTVVDGPDPEI